MHARRGSRHHLLVVGSGCDRVEGVVGKDNRIETSNNFLQQVSEGGMGSSETEEPEETKFEARLCSLQEEWLHSRRFRLALLSRMQANLRTQEFQRAGAEKLQVS